MTVVAKTIKKAEILLNLIPGSNMLQIYAISHNYNSRMMICMINRGTDLLIFAVAEQGCQHIS